MYSVIIADDEQIECRALEHKINDLLPELKLLPSVYDGLSLLRDVESKQPDIVIVDINMPGMSGLDAVELLKAHRPKLKVIINTSYSDFSFIQKALQLGAGDYLLKPGSRTALMTALTKMMKQLDTETQERNEKMQGNKLVSSLQKIVQKKWILSLLIGTPDAESFEAVAMQYPQIRYGGYFTAWKKEDNTNIGGIIEYNNGSDGDEIEMKITSQLQDLVTFISVFYRGWYYCFLMAQHEDDYSSVEDILWHVQKALSKGGVSFRIGCSRWKSKPEQYMTGIHEAQAALQSARSTVSFFQYGNGEIHEKKHYVFTDLTKRMLACECNEVEEILNQVCKMAEIEHIEDEAFKSQSELFLTEIYREAELLIGTERGNYIPGIDWKGMRESQRRQEVCQYLNKTICNLKRYLQNIKPEEKNSAYVNKTLIYIYENYWKDISLESIADQLEISPFYLSRLLRQELNATFLEVLTDVRIRHVIDLLSKGSISGAEAATACGYTGVTYFYRVFKKTTGITFGRMKEWIR